MKRLAIGYASRCNMNCRHCFSKPAFRGGEKLDLSFAKELINEARATEITAISFTVGEPILYLQDILQLIGLCTALEIRTNVVTNAYWAGTPASADQVVESLKRKGLGSLSISSDTFHQRGVPLGNALQGAKSCVDAGLDYTIRMTTDLHPADLAVFRDLKSRGLKVVLKEVAHFGSAEPRQAPTSAFSRKPSPI